VKIIIVVLFIVFFYCTLLAQQVAIDRIELMPDIPQPYLIRDWKNVAIGYDSMVFNLTASGDYLPLIWTDAGGINYPSHNRFGIHSYVGVPHLKSAEAINVIPAVISATLVGVDKSDQNGYNWVEMCEEFFNKRPEENVYLNNFSASSGNDWWYDTMPNIFFYQLYHFYPDQGDFHWQFTTIADRWLEAITKMGGSATPWQKPYMNYRAWKLADMSPLESGVKQPEAAGALAWIQYMAFTKTADESYRIGAEWAMEFLSEWNSNPSYELQLPYGAYIAARMNAELGADYDVEKLINWCFTTEGNVRNWGMTLGNWGGYDCYGLIGEAVNEGYAFAMNSFEHAGALVPMVRYDDRFARAIGKWLLHCANASRLFYSNYLPDDRQDNETWTHDYDTNSYIAYEALRENKPFSGVSPYATGDAMNGGWAETNLALYGSSHAGIFGAIVDTTNIEKILKLDALKTDYFRQSAYPTYLLYNPFDHDTSIVLTLPEGSYDIYDAVGNTFQLLNVSQEAIVTIPADAAVLAVLTPAGGTQRYQLNQLLIDDVVVDYNAGQAVANYPPRIKSLAAVTQQTSINQTVDIYCTAEDRDQDTLEYDWQCTAGSISGNSAVVNWTAPAVAGNYTIFCEVSDGAGGKDSAQIIIEVSDNREPEISQITFQPSEVDLNETSVVTCIATDPDNDSLFYSWSAAKGALSGQGKTVQWNAPDEAGYYFVACTVQDSQGGSVTDSAGISVGRLVGSYPFDGDAQDTSGFNNHGQVNGAVSVTDRFGNTNGAYYFDGQDDHIRVNNHSSLNFENEISVLFWMRIDSLFEREAYPLSHGNWENRWKISITNDGIRWTVKTTAGIKDLDSDQKLIRGKYYHIGCVYDGSRYEIYINGELDKASTHSGTILFTSFDLTIGQVLPDNSAYNFKGVLDDILIYNKGLSGEEIRTLYELTTGLYNDARPKIPVQTRLDQNYPNPFNPGTVIRYQVTNFGEVSIKIYDLNGRQVEVLINEFKKPGYYSISWNGENLSSGIYFITLQTGRVYEIKKCIKLK
jgi:hypothetical protein